MLRKTPVALTRHIDIEVIIPGNRIPGASRRPGSCPRRAYTGCRAWSTRCLLAEHLQKHPLESAQLLPRDLNQAFPSQLV